MPIRGTSLSASQRIQSRGDSLGTFPNYFSSLTEINFLEFEYFTGLTTIGSGATTQDSGWARKRIKISLPTGLTSIGHKIFTACNFYAQDQLVIPASVTSVGSETGFSNITTLHDIIFLAAALTRFQGYYLLNNTTANLVFPNATAVPQGAGSLGSFKGYIYVPDALVDDWKVAASWSSLASRILPLSQWSQS